MSFDRPDLRTLIDRITTDINSRFTSYNALRRRVAAVLGRVLAGAAHGLYGHIDWAQRQILPDEQDEDTLLRYGALMGVPRRGQTYATGTLTATGADGSVIAAGTVWQRDDGAEFEVMADVTVAAGTADVSLRAVEPGADANTEAAVELFLVSPIDGVDPTGILDAGGISGGIDLEDIDAYRTRVLTRMATYITGANAAVYRQWALEVAGVTRAWVYEQTPAAGSVTVLFVCEGDDPIIPDAARIAEVADYLEEHADPVTGALVGRAVNVDLVVDAPDPVEIDFTILPNPNTAAVRAAIEAELRDMLGRDAEPGGTIYLSRISEAISAADGEESHVLTAPAADVVCVAGEIAVMGTITWS